MYCLFCDIVSKQKPSRIVYEDENAMAFYDIDNSEKAEKHILFVPKTHFTNILDIDPLHLSTLLSSIKKYLISEKDNNLILLTRAGKQAGQEIMHLHFHLYIGVKEAFLS